MGSLDARPRETSNRQGGDQATASGCQRPSVFLTLSGCSTTFICDGNRVALRGPGCKRNFGRGQWAICTWRGSGQAVGLGEEYTVEVLLRQ